MTTIQPRERNGRYTSRGHHAPQPGNNPHNPAPHTNPTGQASVTTAYQTYQRRLLTTGEAARYVGVSTSTIRRWIELDLVRAIRIGAGAHWRVDAQDLDRILTHPLGPNNILGPDPENVPDDTWDWGE